MQRTADRLYFLSRIMISEDVELKLSGKQVILCVLSSFGSLLLFLGQE